MPGVAMQFHSVSGRRKRRVSAGWRQFDWRECQRLGSALTRVGHIVRGRQWPARNTLRSHPPKRQSASMEPASGPTLRGAPVERRNSAVGLSKSRRDGKFPCPIGKRPFPSEIPNRLLKHDFRAENPDVSSGSGSIGRRPFEWFERRRTIPTFFGTHLMRRAVVVNSYSGQRTAILRVVVAGESRYKCVFLSCIAAE